MIDDLTMLANLPVVDAETTSKAMAEADKAAAAETMPPPKRKQRKARDTKRKARDTKSSRVARRGQDPPEPEEAGKDS